MDAETTGGSIMKEQHLKGDNSEGKPVWYKDGRLYFTARMERTFYFVLTLLMLIAGVVYKLWI